METIVFRPEDVPVKDERKTTLTIGCCSSRKTCETIRAWIQDTLDIDAECVIRRPREWTGSPFEIEITVDESLAKMVTYNAFKVLNREEGLSLEIPPEYA